MPCSGHLSVMIFFMMASASLSATVTGLSSDLVSARMPVRKCLVVIVAAASARE